MGLSATPPGAEPLRALHKGSMSLEYRSQCCHGLRYPLHLTACPNHPLQGSGGTVEPLATGHAPAGGSVVHGR
jgi:hypothetical protein